MLISIDHGNSNIKSIHFNLPTALEVTNTKPPIASEVIYYEGKYYTSSSRRIAYKRDKTEDSRFFILTLLMIAKELSQYGFNGTKNPISIELAIGLPPAHYGKQFKKFEQYFLNRGVIEFFYNDDKYIIHINNVKAFPQAYAAAITVISEIKDDNKTTIIDIGGFTLDILQLRKGQVDLSLCDSLENGVITLFQKIISRVNSELDFRLDEQDIINILVGDEAYIPESIKITIEETKIFINNMIAKLREMGIDLRVGKTVFVGGGSLLLKNYLLEVSLKIGKSIIVEDIKANAKGYSILYQASRS